MDRICSGPWGDGANWTRHRVVGGGCLHVRRCCVVRRFTLTNCWRSCWGTPLSRLVIETMSNPIMYCSCASSKVQISGPHWTPNSSTCVNRRLYLIFLGSARAKTLRMEAFSPGASLPRRGSMVGAECRLEAAFLLGPLLLFVLRWRTMRGPSLRVDREGGGGMFPMASAMVGCLDALLTARGVGLSGMLSQFVVKMALHRGAMERVSDSGPEI